MGLDGNRTQHKVSTHKLEANNERGNPSVYKSSRNLKFMQ